MAERARLPVQTENDWRDHTIIPFARLKGWLVFFVQRSDRSPSGWPDLVLCRPPRFLVRELKTERGRLTVTQQRWLAALRAAGVDADTWRPSMWAAIQLELA